MNVRVSSLALFTRPLALRLTRARGLLLADTETLVKTLRLNHRPDDRCEVDRRAWNETISP